MAKHVIYSVNLGVARTVPVPAARSQSRVNMTDKVFATGLLDQKVKARSAFPLTGYEPKSSDLGEGFASVQPWPRA